MRVGEYTDRRFSEIENHIEAEDKDYLLNVNETEYVDYLTEQYRVDSLVLEYEEMTVETVEKNISSRELAEIHGVYSTGFSDRSKVEVLVFNIPFSGDRNLLKCRPNSYVIQTIDATIRNNEIEFEILTYRKGDMEIINEKQTHLRLIKTHDFNLEKDIKYFNDNLKAQVSGLVSDRKKEVMRQQNLMQSLGISIKRSKSVPSTFSVPILTKKIIVKPTAPAGKYQAEPTLDNANYQEILKVIDDLGKAMERQPSIYKGRGEEALRDLFIMQMVPHFESSTGETFNKNGKTDILIRHEGKNAFIAECKIWKGDVVYQKTVDQLLSYVTWRDTKTAVMIFVQNKDMTNVLSQVRSETEKHPCFVKFKGAPSEGRFDFEFHLPDDSSRSVQLSVLCFHLSETK